MNVTEAIKEIRDHYTDTEGRIVMADGDGGDSLHKFTITMSLLKMLGKEHDYLNRPIKIGYEETMQQYEVMPGVLVRHPNIPWNNATDSIFPTTRDQVDPAFQTMDLFGDKERALRVTKDMISRGYKYPNGDIISPEHLSHILDAIEQRGTIEEIVHILGDVFLLGHSIIRVVISHFDSDDVSNDVHHILNLIKRRKYRPGLLNYLAKVVYKFRGNAGPKDGPKLDGFAPTTAVRWYFREEKGSPPLDVLYEPLIEEYLK